MKLLTNRQMKDIEYIAIEKKGVPSILLMEHAAMAVTKECLKENPTNVLIFAGKGNNGGDGLAVARQLLCYENINTAVVFIGDPSAATKDCAANLAALKAYDADIIYIDSKDDLEGLERIINASDVVIDAIVGTGLHTKLHEMVQMLVKVINEKANYIISVDCPSGVNTNTGEDYGTAVYADKTVTFHLPKVGLMLYPAFEHVGELVIGSISIPVDTTYEPNCYYTLTDKEAAALIPARGRRTHKGTFGKAMLVAGCDLMAGAALIACTAAYRTGCGLVRACVNPYVATVIHNGIPEAVTTILPDKDGKLYGGSFKAIEDSMNEMSVIAAGCGLGNTKEIYDLIAKIAENTEVPLILDGDALNVLEGKTDILRKLKAPCIITPHLKEMARLTGLDAEYIADELVAVAGSFAKEFNVITVLKDAHTIIALPNGDIYINTTGSNAMSKGGSGDCLTGAIAGLIAQGVSPENAALLACYICGKAGEKASEGLGDYGVLARDTANNIPLVINELVNDIRIPQK
ncbi:MAG: NAD(P)H-hydrate dehydratase [Firmicutes bacterium]|nr:NAD(P)H-hydrate dehydratase [Bacillota bacterium]